MDAKEAVNEFLENYSGGKIEKKKNRDWDDNESEDDSSEEDYFSNKKKPDIKKLKQEDIPKKTSTATLTMLPPPPPLKKKTDPPLNTSLGVPSTDSKKSNKLLDIMKMASLHKLPELNKELNEDKKNDTKEHSGPVVVNNDDDIDMFD